MVAKNILIVYPETHKTRIAVYLNNEPIFLKTIRHNEEDFAEFNDITAQKELRKKLVIEELEKNHYYLDKFDIVMGRSGMVKPVSQGVYRINEHMIKDLENALMGSHATNLGGQIAYDIAQQIGKEAYMANPVVVDELSDIARITGHPKFVRKSVFHALNHKHVANKYAKQTNKKYEDLNLIVCHIGSGGVSVGAHKKGFVVDVNQAFDGGGPFSITRSGTLPVGQLVNMCFSGEYSKDEIIEMITKKGGYSAYLGTDNIEKINRMLAEGDELAKLISTALSYQVSKEIASHVATLEGEVDAIILTGIIFDSEQFLENVQKRVSSIAPIALYPSVNDFEALAQFANQVLSGEIEVKEY